MSETENRIHRVTWRSVPGFTQAGSFGEFLDSHDVTAAYYVREDGMVVFKKANGAITFTVAEPLVETIRPIEDAAPKATGGVVQNGLAYIVGDGPRESETPPREQIAEASGVTTFSLDVSAPMAAEVAAELRRSIRQRLHRNPGTAVA